MATTKVTDSQIVTYAGGKTWYGRGASILRVYVGDVYYDTSKRAWESTKLTESELSQEVERIEKMIADGLAESARKQNEELCRKQNEELQGEAFYASVKSSPRFVELGKFPKSSFTWSVTKLDGGYVFCTPRRDSTEYPCEQAIELTDNKSLQGRLCECIQRSSLRLDDGLDSKSATVYKWVVDSSVVNQYIDELKNILLEMYNGILKESGMSDVKINFFDCE